MLKKDIGKKLKKIFICIFLAICLIGQSFFYFSQNTTLYPIFDSAGTDLPRNLRTVQQLIVGNSPLNLQGLTYLRASGSGQFSENTFSKMLQHLKVSPHQLIVLDLREESHGFINGKSISWTDGIYNYGNLHKSRTEIESDENHRLKLAEQTKFIIVNPFAHPSTKLTVTTITTERAFIENLGSSYIRLPVTDHNPPTNEIIDQFIEIVKNLSSDQWLHFHCKGGKGRTTTFLILFDIMKNAHSISLSDILARQQSIGGVNLNEIDKKVGEMKRAAEARFELIQQFYLYCRQVPDFQVNWSTWIKQQQEALVNNS